MKSLQPDSTTQSYKRSLLCRRPFALAAALAAISLAAPAALVHAADKPAVVVKMSDKPPKFMPETATIKPGQTIQWINDAKTLHSVDADASMVQNPKDVVLPKGAKPFDSGFMQPGATYEHTFTVPGTYKYTCVPHEKDHMNGEVVVK